jgi:protein TonB
VQGTVRLRAVVSPQGSVEQLQLISGHPLLAQAAIQAVRQWQYKPTLLNGQPVEVMTEIEVSFNLS